MGNLTSRGNGPRARTSGLCDNPATPSWSRPANGDSRFALSLSGEGRAFRLSLSTREAAAFAAMVAEHEGDALAAEYDARTARPSPLTPARRPILTRTVALRAMDSALDSGDLAAAAVFADAAAAVAALSGAFPDAATLRDSAERFRVRAAAWERLTAAGFRLATRLDLARDNPAAFARVESFGGFWAAYDGDPDGDADSFAIVGDNRAALIRDAVDSLAGCLADPANVAREAMRAAVAALSGPDNGDPDSVVRFALATLSAALAAISQPAAAAASSEGN